MMNKNGIEQLADHLLTGQFARSDVPAEIAKQIAREQASIEELDELSTALTGESSALQADIARLVSEPLNLELLSAYVDAQMAGADAAQLYPTIARRIQNEVDFRTEYETLLELMQTETQGHFGESPTGLSFVTLQQQAAPITATNIGTTNALWQAITTDVNRLLISIPILVGKRIAEFGQLAPPLIPELVSAGVYRGRTVLGAQPESERYIAALTLPSRPGLNWTPQVRLGGVEDGRSTVILIVTMLTPPQPIPQAKVMLRDADSNLLESLATDEKGLAAFSGLETGTYQFEVEYKGQIEQFSVTLTPQNR